MSQRISESTYAEIDRELQAGKHPKEVAELFGVGRSSTYRRRRLLIESMSGISLSRKPLIDPNAPLFAETVAAEPVAPPETNGGGHSPVDLDAFTAPAKPEEIRNPEHLAELLEESDREIGRLEATVARQRKVIEAFTAAIEA